MKSKYVHRDVNAAPLLRVFLHPKVKSPRCGSEQPLTFLILPFCPVWGTFLFFQQCAQLDCLDLPTYQGKSPVSGANIFYFLTKNIPTTSFLKAFLPSLPFKTLLPQGIHHSRTLFTPLNLTWLSQNPDRSLSSESMCSLWKGRAAAGPESELVGEYQQWLV